MSNVDKQGAGAPGLSGAHFTPGGRPMITVTFSDTVHAGVVGDDGALGALCGTTAGAWLIAHARKEDYRGRTITLNPHLSCLRCRKKEASERPAN